MPSGAETLLRSAAAAGLDVCFANPGTTEIDLVRGFAGSGVRPILGLFEGVCTGAADAYARMSGRPALVLLHLGPGLANGLANLHNAAKARTPTVVLVGDHATSHIGKGAPLEADVEGFARPVSRWVRTSRSAETLAGDLADAVAAATAPPGGVATLIVPADCAWGDAFGVAETARPAPPAPVGDEAVAAAASVLDGSAVLLLGGDVLRTEAGLQAAGRIAAATGCRLLSETFPARIERGAGLPEVPKLEYFPEPATAQLHDASALVLAGAPSPIAFFAYPGLPSEITPPHVPETVLSAPGQDGVDALERLAAHLGATARPLAGAAPVPAAEPGPLTVRSLGAVLAAVQPEGAIVVDEGITSSGPYWELSAGAPRHTLIALTGGAIGMGPPAATGAAVACPDRPVLALQADGSAMYTLQALWTQARERLDVTTIVCANRGYRILDVELARAGVDDPGPVIAPLTDLGTPPLDWVALAAGMGVPGMQATTAEELKAALRRSLAEDGPHVIEAII